MTVLMAVRRTAVATILAGAVVFGGAGCADTSGPSSPDTDVDLLAQTDQDSADAPVDGVGPSCTAAQRWTALAVVAPRVRDALAADPDLAAELDRIHGLDRDQGRTELRQYLSSRPELAGQVQQARDTLARYRTSCTIG